MNMKEIKTDLIEIGYEKVTGKEQQLFINKYLKRTED